MKMPQWTAGSKLSPIGVDLDGRSMSAVQLRRGRGVNGQWTIEAATVLPRLTSQLPPDTAEISRFTDVLRRQGFVGNQMVLAAPNQKLLTGVLDLPPASANAPFDQIARMELARMHKCEPDTFELSYWELPSRQRGGSANSADAERRQANAPRNVMAAACTIADSSPLLNVFEDEGWDVQALDIQSWAMLRACASAMAGSQDSLAPQASSSAALLGIGWDGALLVLRHQDTVVYQRTLDEAGIKPLHAAVMEQTSANAELADLMLYKAGLERSQDAANQAMPSRASLEARRVIGLHLDLIVREVRTSCSYMAHRYADASPKVLLVMGEGAAISGIDEYLARELEMEVKTVAASDVAQCAGSLTPLCEQPRGTALMTAIGLAMWTEKQCHGAFATVAAKEAA